MKLRSPYELSTALDNELAWRKRELTNLYFSVTSCKRDHQRDALLRAAIPIVYAHWEGFTKKAATSYLEFVSRQRLMLSELKTNFVAIICRSTLKEASSSQRAHIHTQLVDYLTFHQSDRARLPYQDVIQTDSNLSSAILKNILFTIDLPYDDYWEKKTLLIDGSMLYARNRVAHGEREIVTSDTYENLHKFVIDALDYLKRSIETSASNQSYKRSVT